MNVGRMCRAVPAGQPHEYLGFTKTSLKGTLLSIQILDKVIKEENEATEKGSNSATARKNKHVKNK